MEEKRYEHLVTCPTWIKGIVYNGTWETKTKHVVSEPYCQRCRKNIIAGDRVKYRHYAKTNFYYLCERCAKDLEKEVREYE